MCLDLCVCLWWPERLFIEKNAIAKSSEKKKLIKVRKREKTKALRAICASIVVYSLIFLASKKMHVVI